MTTGPSRAGTLSLRGRAQQKAVAPLDAALIIAAR
jgi:hypothetical protein